MMAPDQPRRRKAKAFVRVSTNKQDNARQRRDVEKLARKFNLEALAIYELDGLSGRKVRYDKKFLQAFNDVIKDPECEGLIVSAIDRFFRCDRYDDPGLFNPLADAKKLIWSVVEGEVEPWTDEGFNTCMTAALKSGAEWRELRRRTCDGKADKAADGFLPHGNAWFGVDIKGRKDTGIIGEGKAVLNEREAAIAREAWELGLAAEGCCYRVAVELNARGYRNKGENGQPGAEFSRKTVYQMFTNPSYKGKHLWNGITINVPVIVSEELFDAMQAKLKLRADWVGRPSQLYLLRKFGYCARCKKRLIGIRSSGSSKNPKLCYRCGNRTDKPPQKRLCSARQIQADRLEGTSWSALWGHMTEPETLLEMGRDLCVSMAAPDQELMDAAKARIQELKQEDRNLSRMMKEAADDEEYNGHARDRRQVRARIATVEAEMQSRSQVANFPPLEMVQAFARDIGSNEPKTYDERRPILERLVDLRIEYDDRTEEVTITGAVPISAEVAERGEGGKYCRPRVHDGGNTYQPIPFILKRRVA